jgi:hypothetical protein
MVVRFARMAVLFTAALSAACTSSSAPSPATSPEVPAGPEWFRDVTAEVGLDCRQHAGATGAYFMPQVMGSGLGLIDVEGDGRFDLIVLNNAGPDSGITHRLFRQGADGRFRDATKGSGLDVAGYGMGVAVGDVDNDGWPDAYISQYGGGRLFRNRGDGTFEDRTTAAGVANPRWGTSCSFLDHNRDGWLDLIVVCYVDYNPSHNCTSPGGLLDYCHPNQFPGSEARLYQNRGRSADGVWQGFEDATSRSGLASKPSNGLGVLCADFDGDGWVDIFAANDARANHLWINRRNGTFEEEGLPRGVAFNGAGNAQANMGVVYHDLDGDGRPDVFVTHLAEELHTLWQQIGPGRFTDATARTGLGNPLWRGTGFGVVAADFDLDGHVDLAVANGRVSRSRLPNLPGLRSDLPEFWHSYAERNQLFASTGTGSFRDVSRDAASFTQPPAVSRGLAWTDLDGDGAVDLIATSIEGPVRVFRNVAPKKGRWLIVRAFDPERKRDAPGAEVRVRAGTKTWAALASPGLSYCTSGDPRAFFGLGAVDRIEEIVVRWPEGTQESFPGGAPDRVVTVNRGQGRAVP